MTIKEKLEMFETQMLSPYATLSKNTKGRKNPITPCDMRTEFCRDRDRILHSKAFRRLKHKTQVFIQPAGDHYRTRLTHTLEVSQIARAISRSLFLNEDLTEAIALGHDLGHTPFGHEGERALDTLSPRGFNHNEQSLRVVQFLESDKGLNLTAETEDGILCHTGPVMPSTPEGCVVRLSDKIAYINHDIDDAIRAQILCDDDLPKEAVALLGKTGGARIDAMIKNVIASSPEGKISMSEDFLQATLELEAFMFRNVYIDSVAKEEEKKVFGVLSGIYERCMNDEQFKNCPDPDRAVCDYIASMTDSYCVEVYKKMFIPVFWKKV